MGEEGCMSAWILILMFKGNVSYIKGFETKKECIKSAKRNTWPGLGDRSICIQGLVFQK